MKAKNGKILKNIRLNKEIYSKIYKPVFFTTIANFRKPYFTVDQLNMQIITCLKEIFNSAGIVMPLYCLMPDHLHFICYLKKEGKNLLNMVNYFKSKTSKIGEIFCIENLWQRRYYDYVIRKHESFKEICEYIYNNPVRKGLAENSDEYKYSEIEYHLLDIYIRG